MKIPRNKFPVKPQMWCPYCWKPLESLDKLEHVCYSNQHSITNREGDDSPSQQRRNNDRIVPDRFGRGI